VEGAFGGVSDLFVVVCEPPLIRISSAFGRLCCCEGRGGEGSGVV
jgi:hypothetical protein